MDPKLNIFHHFPPRFTRLFFRNQIHKIFSITNSDPQFKAPITVSKNLSFVVAHIIN